MIADFSQVIGKGKSRVDSGGAGGNKGRAVKERDVQGFPVAYPGMTTGLLGGSFDPAHEGHAHITREALKRFGLNRVWWLVSPGNPLKSRQPAPIADRIAKGRQVMGHPRVVISDLEARLGTRYTAETLQKLMALYPGVRFVWLMGADNLAQFHLWQDWEWIMHNVPVGVFARPGARLAARGARAAEEYARFRLPSAAALMLPRMRPPVWAFLDVPMVNISSSAIRARGDWRA